MHLTNTISKYGLISKLFHWLTALLLFIQIPLGFYLVDLDFGKERINFDLADQFCDIHIIANYTLIALLTLHILAVIIHRFIFKENILKKMI